MGLLVAPHWTGPYTRMGVKIFGEHADNEDPFLWRSERGVHMLMHSMLKDHDNKKKRGGYAFSTDGFEWHHSTDEAWDNDLRFDDCEGQTLGKRQCVT